jgi:nitrate/nitrite transporter NarK
MSPETYGRFCAAQFAVSFGLAYVIGWLADRFHPIRLIVAFYVLHATAVGVGFLAVRDATTFGIIHVVTGACAGIWFTAYASFLPRMVPRGHYATFASAISLVTALGTMLVAPACGWFLDAMVDHAYRYIYLWSLVFDVAALLVILSVARTFAASGGPRHFVPPDPNGAPAAGAAAGASP